MRFFHEILIVTVILLVSRVIRRVDSFPSESVHKIVGGADINIEKVPYALAMLINGKLACGAGIITNNWAITAAHCVKGGGENPLETITLRSGSSFHDRGGVVHKTISVHIHEKYNNEISDYDIAVLKVDPPFKFDNFTGPAKLPGKSSVKTDWGIATGWGYFMPFDPVLSYKLEYVALPKVERNECVREYKGRYTITQRQVCYGFRQGGKDSCKGDSGGAFVNKDGTIIGITSWGDGCAKPYSPGVYTDVILLQDWVRSKIQD